LHGGLRNHPGYGQKDDEMSNNIPEGWALVPEDLITHINDWRNACEHMLSNAPRPTEDQNDAGYWQHQLDVLDKIEKDLADKKAREKRAAYDKAWEDANRSAGVYDP